MNRQIVAPQYKIVVREISDAAGKRWRAYFATINCNGRLYAKLLKALPISETEKQCSAALRICGYSAKDGQIMDLEAVCAASPYFSRDMLFTANVKARAPDIF